jgi:hypothetical protein
MFKGSQLLDTFPWIALTHKQGHQVDICEALHNRDARLYHISDKSPDGTQVLDEPKWFFDFKHSKGQTRSIEIPEEQATELSEHCGVKIETFADDVFWF